MGVDATSTRTGQDGVNAALAKLGSADATTFAALIEPYRRQLHVHCYRMLGSFDDAEDLVQETLLRAWTGRSGFEGRSSFKTWLYRIATNACLNALERRQRRVLPPDIVPATEFARNEAVWDHEIPWLQPYPDEWLEPSAPSRAEPDAVVVARETIELTYLAAIQHFPPRQRAILILRDSLGWSAKEVATLLELSVPSVNSALQRARATMRARLPERRLDWSTITEPTDDERAVLRRYMDAIEQADSAALTALLREDARQLMPPAALWFDGRDSIGALYSWVLAPGSVGDFRMLATAANRQPAAACYVRAKGESEFRLVGLNILRIEGGEIAEITSFTPELCWAFDLPPTL